MKRDDDKNPINIKERSYPANFVMELFNITRQQLYYWRKNLLKATGNGTGKQTLYSFQDLVGIKTILKLREEGVSTHMITRVIKKSKDLFPDMENLLSNTPVIPSGGRLIVLYRGDAFDGATGQGVFISLLEVEKELEERIREKLRETA
ncbi:MAG: MerR family transcriptional regulator [Deltaproteobacteria bacterium]|uniref:MerR family transcriptional regulator n=1 Tax=Candidatus Zymogenus saltonus TaxID=2844893 RepID=A0A9D8KBC3_9DELT|nr:MerR family transcriptional regulator [Candidatus Zymogenus saltonus]